MEKIILKAQPRTVTGKKVKHLRDEAILPANVFGNKEESRTIQLTMDSFTSAFKKAGETTLIELEIGEQKTPVLVSNVQVDPLTSLPIHVDFHAVNLKEKVTATVPVELTGESPAEKSGIGTVVLQLDEVEVEALPGDLPEKFDIDASMLLEVDQAVYVRDLKVDSSKVEIKEEADAIVAKVEPPQKEEVVVAPVVEAPTTEASEETLPPQENSDQPASPEKQD